MSLLIPIICVSALVGCKEKHGIVDCDIKNPIAKDHVITSIQIPVDSLQYKHDYNDVIGDYYIGLDKGRNSLDIFNLKNQSYSHTINFPIDGSQNGIKISDFVAYSTDSIFIFSEMEYKLFIINLAGEVTDKRQFHQQFLEELHQKQAISGIESWIARMYYDPYYKRLFFPATPVKMLQEDGFYDQKYILSYALESDQFDGIFGHYPSNYNDSFKTPATDAGWFYIFKSDKDSTVSLSFSYSNEILKINWATDKLIDTKYICSNYENVFEPYEYDLGNINQAQDFIYKRGIRLKPVYNPATKNYYFPVRQDQTLLKPDGKKNLPLEANWSLIKCNQDLKPISEAKMERGCYNFFNIHAFGDHLIISNENNDPDEDILKFTIQSINNDSK